MIIYIFNILVVIVCGCLAHQKIVRPKPLYILCVCQLIAVVAFRGIHIGTDTIAYINLLHMVRPLGTSVKSVLNNTYLVDYLGYEKGFLVYTFFLSKLHAGDNVYLIVSALISLIPIFIFIYLHSDSPFMALLCFIIFGFYSFEFNTLRQAVAMGIAFIALLIFEYCPKKYIAIIPFLIAISIHNSAFIMPVYLLPKVIKRLTPIKSTLSLLGFAGFVFISNKLIPQFYLSFSKYANRDLKAQNNISTVLFIFAIFLYFMIGNNNINIFDGVEKDEMLWLYFYILLLTTGQSVGVMTRSALYLFPGVVITIPNLFKKRLTVQGLVIYSVTILLMFYQYFHSIINDPNLVPYHFWF